MAKKRTHHVTVYDSYRFRDKDPIIDRVRTLFEDERISYADAHRAGCVTPNTLSAWFTGKTKRPQFCSIAATVRALGYDFRLVRGVNRVHDIGRIINVKVDPRPAARRAQNGTQAVPA